MSTDVNTRSVPADELPQGSSHFVTLYPDAVTVQVRGGETIVDGLRRHGLRTRYKCRRGGCGVCRATLLTGEVSYPNGVCQDVIDGTEQAPAEASETRCLPCRAVPATDVCLLLGASDQVIDVLGTVLPTTAAPKPAGGSPYSTYERSNPCPS